MSADAQREVVGATGATGATGSELGEPDHVGQDLAERDDALLDREYRLDWYRAFLAVLSNTRNVSASARAAGRNRPYVYEARNNDPDFAEAWKDALEIGADRLEQVALRRATVGERRRTIRRKTKRERDASGAMRVIEEIVEEVESTYVSDMLLLAMLKSARPEKFRERYEHRLTDEPPPGDENEIWRQPTSDRTREMLRMALEYELPIVEGYSIRLVPIDSDASVEA